jgi:hypothetical protein
MTATGVAGVGIMDEKIPVCKLTNESLLDEYASLERWAGDDFAVDQITAKECRRKGKLRKEILRRMKA